MEPNDQKPVDGAETTPVETTNTEAVNTAPVTENTAPAEVPAANSESTNTSLTTPEAPVVGTVAPATVPIESAPKKRFNFLASKKAKLIALVVAIVILLGGASAGAYFGIIAPAQPQRVIGDSLGNTLNSDKIKSAKFEGEATCVEGDDCKTFSAVTFKGGANENGSFDANLQFKTAVATIGLDARYIDKAVYLRLSGLNGLDKLLASFGGGGSETTSQYAAILTQLNDKWYTFDESLLKQMGGSFSVPSSNDKLSKEDAQKIADAYKQHQFIKIDKKLADEKIHGQSSYHYQTTIDKTQLKAFATAVKNANIKDLKIEQKDIDELDKVDFSKYPFEIWVNKSNRMISQLATTIKQDGTTLKIRLALYDYNLPVTVEKPAGAKSVLELLSEVAPLYSGGVQGAESENPFSLLGI